MHAFDRRQQIAQILLSDGRVSTTELADKYGVSTETIRKDIAYLEETGLAKRGYGGAVISSELNELSFIQKNSKNQDVKMRIAQAAMQHVHDGDIVILDSGSTMAAFARVLSSHGGITVITNSLHAASLLQGRVKHLYLLGGALQPTSGAATGAWGLNALADLHADVAFIGTSGFAQMDGPCVESVSEAEIKKAMIRSATRSILLADSSKTGLDAMVRFAPWSAFERLITDADLSEAAATCLQERIQVEFAP